MKPAALLLLLAASAFAPEPSRETIVAALNTPPLPAGTIPGRFQLLATTIPGADGKPVPATLRIDTATGQVWELRSMHLRGDGNTGQALGWVLTPEDFGESIQALQRALRAR